MHFESIFFNFLNLENGLFQTHSTTKSGKFQIFFFFEAFPSGKNFPGFIVSVDFFKKKRAEDRQHKIIIFYLS